MFLSWCTPIKWIHSNNMCTTIYIKCEIHNTNLLLLPANWAIKVKIEANKPEIMTNGDLVYLIHICKCFNL